MAFLTTLLDTKTTETVVRLASKAGMWAVLAVVLVFFLMGQVLTGQHETRVLITQHQADSKDALRDQLELLRIICANLAVNHTQATYCFAVGRTRLEDPQP